MDKAITSFVQFASIKQSPLLEAQASQLVGLCYEHLGERELALRWHEKAYVVAYEDLQLVDERYDKIANNSLRTFRKYSERHFYLSLFGIPLGLLSDLTDPANYQLVRISGLRDDYRSYLAPLARVLVAKSSLLSNLKEAEYFENNSNFSQDEPCADIENTVIG